MCSFSYICLQKVRKLPLTECLQTKFLVIPLSNLTIVKTNVIIASYSSQNKLNWLAEVTLNFWL